MRLATSRAAHAFGVAAAHELLKVSTAVVARIFVDRHIPNLAILRNLARGCIELSGK